jgi:hypothetical protein
VEVETCKCLKNPLEFVRDKFEKFKVLDENEMPDELWIVFPYRKLILYGAKAFKEKFVDNFKQFAKKNNLIENGFIKKFMPRVFFVDVYNKKLCDLDRFLSND